MHETLLIPSNARQKWTQMRFRCVVSESQGKGLEILHPDLEISLNCKAPRSMVQCFYSCFTVCNTFLQFCFSVFLLFVRDVSRFLQYVLLFFKVFQNCCLHLFYSCLQLFTS